VKLGTITPHGADVYSYAPDEDDMVTDPALGDHLAHWGINMLQVRMQPRDCGRRITCGLVLMTLDEDDALLDAWLGDYMGN